ncbi:glutamyl-tRNA synthetase [Tistlia consotensis]|uniref:Glutamate--tRNA ligase n=1 Tax=Tistlia consotensis USBA 355 TaxID=560819 RepID=A0A1Y6CSD8_9PROT|nr:glutamate--tRNA ligase [Tistlia consotensis]SMF69939.1 glutamyl-tRNA synthetase [Tistlia consotensis USBA 355]SNS05048.1 glutamyl-tRNA synthetase [Tistlia consotensis]
MPPVTRFAPSPTGFLHIGGARTALFNWLYARHHGGRFLLRIEDTDRARSTEAAIAAILDGLAWLGLEWDGEVVYQFARAERHAEVARRLVAEGRAYYCYATPAELEEMRATARAEGRPLRYDGRWRDRDPAEAPEGVPPVVRMKAPQEGETTIADLVQGEVTVANAQLDDMVLLRADGTPTYMLSVVVDDHDMDITTVIRGDDHLTNAFRQTQLYRLCGWEPPAFAHIPLIHGPDGAKLSKRHGALGVEAYREMGYLPEALRNYLLRLGWAHGDDEIIPTDKAIEWFDLDGVGRSPARFDFDKLNHLNGHYIREADDARLAGLVAGSFEPAPSPAALGRLTAGMAGMKARAKTLKELAELGAFYVAERPLVLNEKAEKLLTAEALQALAALRPRLASLADWTAEAIEAEARAFAEAAGLKLGAVAQPLRAALTGSNVSPPIFEAAAILGRDETLARLDDRLAPP